MKLKICGLARQYSCRYIDIPILVSAAVFVIMAAAGQITSMCDMRISWLNSGSFAAMSLLGNFIVYKLIQLTMRLCGIRLGKFHIFVIGVVFAAVSSYWLVTVLNREFIYYWDYSNYLTKQLSVENAFLNSPKKGIAMIAGSLGSDYTSFINIFTEFPFCLTQRTGNWYTVCMLVNIYAPLLVITATVVEKIGEGYPNTGKSYFALTFTSLVLFPLLQHKALLAMPDWFGIIFCFMIMLLTMDYKFEKVDISRWVTLFAAVFSLMITRRWYMYFIVGYCAMYAAEWAIHIIRGFGYDKENAIRSLRNGIGFVSVSGIITAVVLHSMLIHIISYDYAKNYSAYATLTRAGNILNLISWIGIVYVVIMFIGMGFETLKRKRYSLCFRCLGGAAAAFIMFTNVQDMGEHQALMLLPFVFVFICFGMAAIESARSRVLNIFIALIIAASTVMNYSGTDINTYILPYKNVFVKSRTDTDEIKQLANWLNDNLSEVDAAYIIPQDNSFNSDVVRNALLPDMDLRNKIAPGVAVLGTHKFPTTLLDGKYVVTCEPFPAANQTLTLGVKFNDAFAAVKDKYFKLVKSFDMGNGRTFYCYERIVPADEYEINYYREYFSEENAKFSELFGDVFDEYARLRLKN